MKRSLCILLLLALLACSEEARRERPTYVLPQDSMALVLSEVHVLNAASQHREARKQHFQKFIESEHIALFDSLGIDQARFDSSLNFWLQEPKEMIGIYDVSMNLLSEKLAKVKQKAPVDSVARQKAQESIREMVEKDKNLMKLRLGKKP